MRDISEAEARSLLSSPLHCEGDGEWAPARTQPGTAVLGMGVLDDAGVSTGMFVELMFRRGHRTGITNFMLTVFKRNSYGLERVYQLDVTQSARPIVNAHELSHEHMGVTRSLGAADWSRWGYDEILAYFSAQTNISFDPAPSHPEEFRLRGQ